MKDFEIITALVTPFTDKGKIDYNNLISTIKRQVQNGINAFVLFGTTGEGVSINIKQKITAIKKIRKVFFHSIYLMVGISSLDTMTSAVLARNISKQDIDSLLVLTPTYLKTNEEGIIAHFNHIADASLKPIFIYHVPTRTGQTIKPELFRILKRHPNIKGAKIATDSVSYLEKIKQYQSSNFAIFLGEDSLIIKGLELNLNGLISVSSNAFPKQMKEIVQLYLSNQLIEANDLYKSYQKTMDLFFAEPNPIPIKYYLSLGAIIKDNYHLPLKAPSMEVQNLLKERYQINKL